MKKYFVITHLVKDNQHINKQDLLPASCKLISGIAVNATVKQEGQLKDIQKELAFPQNLIADLVAKDNIQSLFFSYLRTRKSKEESKAYFISDMLPEITKTLSDNIKYTCLDAVQQEKLEQSINALFNTQFPAYLFDEINIYEKGRHMSDLNFADLVIQHVLIFTYLKKKDVFLYSTKQYIQPEPYDCGNISLLVNGNSFLLRDYILSANRKVKNIKKEIIPFHEPLEINSNLHTVFKNYKNSGDKLITIRIYIEYESVHSLGNNIPVMQEQKVEILT